MSVRLMPRLISDPHALQIDSWPTVSYLAAMNFQQSETLAARVVAGLQTQIQAYQQSRHHNTSDIQSATAVNSPRMPKD